MNQQPRLGGEGLIPGLSFFPGQTLSTENLQSPSQFEIRTGYYCCRYPESQAFFGFVFSIQASWYSPVLSPGCAADLWLLCLLLSWHGAGGGVSKHKCDPETLQESVMWLTGPHSPALGSLSSLI